MKRLISSFCLFTLITCGGVSNSAKAQVLAGTKDITTERLNAIVDKMFYGLSSKDKIYSQEFGSLLKEYENPRWQGNFNNINLPGELFFDDSIVTLGIGGEEMTEKAQRQYKYVRGSEKEAVIQVELDQDFGKTGKLHDEAKLCLVKEKREWVLDDVLFVSDQEWSSKYWLKQDIAESITMYKGHMLDEYEPRPFKMCIIINKYPLENGVRRICGVFKFDDQEEDNWSWIIEGKIKDREVFIMVNEEGMGDHSLSWVMNSESKTVHGDWQAYNPDGRIEIDEEFVMTIIQ